LGTSIPSVLLINDGVRYGHGVLQRCSALERKCFAKHEAMDLAVETRGRGSSLIVALEEGQIWPDLGALGASAGGDAPSPAVAGYLVLQRSSMAASVAKLVVAPSRRRQGIGRRLLARAIEIATVGRARVCTLHVDTANAPALALYRSLGFAVVSAKLDYYCVGRDAFAMELDLFPP
jgi:ribosomal protein S18 acetylase RimI-like enzyme